MFNYITTRQPPNGYFTSNETSKDKLYIKVVEKFVKNLFYGEKHSFIEWT